MSLNERAREVVSSGLVGIAKQKEMLCAIIDAASEQLAGLAGHDATARKLGGRSHYHFERRNRQPRPGLGALR